MNRLKTLLACLVLLSFVTLAVITAPADAEAWGNDKIPPGLQKKLNLDENGNDSFWFIPGNGKHIIPYGQLKKTEIFRERHRYVLNSGFTCLEGTVVKALPGDPAMVVLDINIFDLPLAAIRVADDATILIDGREADLADLEGYSAIVLVNPGGNAIVISADSDGNYQDDDRNAPEVNKLKPANGEKDVEPGLKKLVVTFNENIYRVYTEKYIKEKIEVKNVTSNREVGVYDIKINGKELVIRLSRGLEAKSKYTVYIPKGLFRDSDGNKFEGIERGEWKFTTGEEKDKEAPEIVKLEPADGDEDVEVGLRRLSVTYDEAIYRVYSENYIKSRIEVENVTKDKVVGISNIDVSGKELVIDLSRGLEEDCEYSVYIPEGMFRDSEGNKSEGIDRGEWKFTTRDEKDNEDPEIISLKPSDGESVYYNVKEIVARFDEKIRWANRDKGEGRVFVFNLSDNKMLEPREVLIIEDKLVLKFNDYLSKGAYGITILSGAIEDLAGNEFGGISLSEWNFEIK